MGRGGPCSRRGHDVGDHIVDADAFALGEGAESDLDLGHAVRIGVVLRIFAEFLHASQYLNALAMLIFVR